MVLGGHKCWQGIPPGFLKTEPRLYSRFCRLLEGTVAERHYMLWVETEEESHLEPNTYYRGLISGLSERQSEPGRFAHPPILSRCRHNIMRV